MNAPVKIETLRAKTLQAEALRTKTPQAETLRAKTLQAEALRTKTPQAEAIRTKTPQAETLGSETLGSETPQAETLRPARLRVFESFDGTRLFFRHWGETQQRGETQEQSNAAAKRSLILLHRGHEHGGRLAHLADELSLPGTAIYALDARGHGVSRSLAHAEHKNRTHGDAQNVATLVRDLDCFVRHLAEEDGVKTQDIAIVAQSIGAVIACAYVHDYAPPIRGLVLAAPAFDVDLRVPFASQALRGALALGLMPTINSRVIAEELTRDKERQRSYDEDKLITRGIGAALLTDLKDTSDRLIADAAAITVPTQILIAGDDNIVRPEAAALLFTNLGTARKEHHVFEGRRHDLLGERGRRHIIQTARRFLTECFDDPHIAPDLTNADKSGYTHDEAERLRKPFSPFSLRGHYWRSVKAATKAGANLSRGLSIGVETGFDSGATLDYVYRNEAEGSGVLGRLIDRRYLNAIGWRGIRARKAHVEELIEIALSRLEADGAATHIADIAAGRGAYVLDALAARKTRVDSVRLRDFCAGNVEAGSTRIKERNLQGIAWFEQGDAFDAAALAGLKPAPTLAIVSGLYELFADNGRVCASLEGLAQSVPTGGYLIYTNQPWHPQLEQIARTLNSHREGQAWVMRRRTQAEMDQLVAKAGFEKIV